MKNLSIANVIEKNKLSSNQPWLIALRVHVIDPATNNEVEVLRLVKNTEQVSVNGELFSPANFDLNIKEVLGELPPLNVSIQDQTRTIMAKMEQYGGGVGFGVDVVVFQGGAQGAQIEYDTELEESFTVVSGGVSEYVANWELGAESPLRQKFPRRKQYKDRCSARYKQTECGYTGGVGTCDLTRSGPNGCVAHNNEANWGGFSGIIARSM